MSLSIMTQTAALRDLLENLFDSSSPVEHPAFSSETSLFHFAEAGVTPIGGRSQVDLFVCTITSSRIQIFFYKSGIISSRYADFFSFSHHAEPGPRLIQIKYWKNLVTANNL